MPGHTLPDRTDISQHHLAAETIRLSAHHHPSPQEQNTTGNSGLEATTSEPGVTSTKSAPRRFLREIEPCPRIFWQEQIINQLAQEVWDTQPDGFSRALPKNEILVLALNEIAICRGFGFFFHLPNRDCWKKPPSNKLCPQSRIIPTPGGHFPSIYFMGFQWTGRMKEAVNSASPRSRYLNSDGILNPPHDPTPLYGLQYATNERYPLFKTKPPSLIVLSNHRSFYLLDSAQFERIVGLRPKGRKNVQGPDAHLRMDTTPYIWREDNHDHAHALSQFEVSTLLELYVQILQACRPANIPSSFTAKELRALIPRPPAPEKGISLGTPLSSGPFSAVTSVAKAGQLDSANPSTRRNAHVSKKKVTSRKRSKKLDGRAGKEGDGERDSR